MNIYHTKEYHVNLISNMIAEGITGELLDSYVESAFDAAHRAGVAAERERCAGIAENYRDAGCVTSVAGENIAQEIRRGE